MNENGLNYIDLFAGAGGLSEGFIQSGYRPVAHVEMNEHAAKTIETTGFIRGTFFWHTNNTGRT